MDHFIRTPQTLWRTKVVWTRRTLLVCLAAAVITGPAPGQTTPPIAAAQLPDVQAIPGIGSAASASGSQPTITATRKTVTTTIAGSAWVDSTVLVTGGEQLEFTAAGTLSLADGRSLTPAGFARGWKDLLRQFPLNSANTGALIGRVGSDAAVIPFAIGASATVTMPTTGHLFLRANLSDDLTATGAGFKATIHPLAHPRRHQHSPCHARGARRDPRLPRNLRRHPAPRRRPVWRPRRHGQLFHRWHPGPDPGRLPQRRWVAVDKTTQDAVLHGLLSTLQHQAYVEMPMSTLFLFGRAQDLSFARADPLTVAAERHHLRIWKTDQTIAGRPLWVGSCTHDIGFERDQRNNGTTHKIDPNIDLERTFLLDSFNAAGNLSSAAYVLPTDPLTTARTATGGSFRTLTAALSSSTSTPASSSPGARPCFSGQRDS